MKNKIIAVIGIIALSLIIINMSASHSKLSKTVDSKNKISMKTLSIPVGQIYNFDYTGNEQTFEVPVTGKYKIELWGAQGGGNGSWGAENPSYGYTSINLTSGGFGAYTNGILQLSKNNKFHIYIGGNGYQNKGYNEGGIPHYEISYGGGATDIRLKENDLLSRIMVAAGGSGGSGYKATGVAAGGLIGYEGQYHYYNCDSHNLAVKTPALGGTQTQGGIGMICEGNCMHGISNNGLFGKGANDDNLIGMGSYGSGGGGAGYFGGGSGTTTNCDITSSASGSSFISGHNGCVAITEDSTESNIKQRTDLNGNTCTDGTTDITCSYHYSGYKFTDTVMIDGAGYNWTTVKGDYVGQPQPDGTTKEGHSGNGYARITYLGN